MTREELVQMREYQVGAASTEYWNKNKDNEEVGIITAFEDGVTWADEHPKNPWISVEERLPEPEKDEDGNKIGMSVEVFIRTEFVDNNHTYVHHGKSRCYFNSDGGHEWQTPNVTHWMPIPQIKKGGEK